MLLGEWCLNVSLRKARLMHCVACCQKEGLAVELFVCVFTTGRVVEDVLWGLATSGHIVFFFELPGHLSILALFGDMPGVFATYETVRRLSASASSSAILSSMR